METPDWVKRTKVGDKVVCVKQGTEWSNNNYPTVELEVGVVYQIEEIDEEDCQPTGIAFVLCGLPNYLNYGAHLFKPISKRSTDTGMQTLKSILNGSPITETENAH